jgi:osmotically-inducible protein OsmY
VANRAYLVSAVEAKLVGIDADAATTVHVSVRGGIATLSGQAHSAAERNRYASAAKSVRRIVAVQNKLSVNPHSARVTAAIAAQAGLNVVNVRPSASRGVVTLRGTVPSRSVDKTIVQTVRRVRGVKSVVDRTIIGEKK